MKTRKARADAGVKSPLATSRWERVGRVEFGFRGVALFRIEHAERADDDLFGRQARENGDAGFPVQTERFEYGRTCLATCPR
mgnify:CR=1 FL=1